MPRKPRWSAKSPLVVPVPDAFVVPAQCNHNASASDGVHLAGCSRIQSEECILRVPSLRRWYEPLVVEPESAAVVQAFCGGPAVV